jgi:hypothetical protein
VLSAYSLADVVWIWASSVAISVFAYGTWLLGRNRRYARQVPTERDTPLELLDKLHRLGLAVVLDRLEVESGWRPLRVALRPGMEAFAETEDAPVALATRRARARQQQFRADVLASLSGRCGPGGGLF